MSRIMKIPHLSLGVVCMLWICFIHQSVAGKTQSPEKKIRKAARAGQFYPGSYQRLSQTIEAFLNKAENIDIAGEIVGLMVPHAGYEFSGQIAANAYRLLQGRTYDVVIIIGPSHYVGLEGASVGDWDVYETPLGEATIDKEFAGEIRNSSSLISSVPEAHRFEHSVEVQIPFLQTVLPKVPIVPMVIRGELSYKDSEKIAKAIAGAVQWRKVLLVASTDMSHFPSYKDAYDVDLRVLDAVGTYDPKEVLRLNYSLLHRDIAGLDCALCGPSALVTVMLASKELHAEDVRILPYANSGDVSGERHRVVGYGAAAFYKKSTNESQGGDGMMEEIAFTEQEEKKLFTIARKSIESVLKR